MAVKKASTTQDAQIESGHRWLPELSSDWMRPRHMSLKATGSCNVLVVVPHGFPWNDDNAEILGFHLSQELDAYAVINNRKYVKSPPHIIPRSYPTEKQFHKAMKDRVGIHRQMEDVGGFVADLSLLHEAKKWNEDYVRPILEVLDTIHKDCQKPPIVLFLQGMEDEAAEKASPGMLIEVSAGLIEPKGKRDGTASKRLVADLIKGLRETVGPADNLGRFASSVSVQLYLRNQVNYPVEIVQLWTRFGGVRDTEENLKERASQLAQAVRGLDDFESSQTQPAVAAKQSAPAPAALQTDPLVEEAVAFINEKANETIYKGSIEIGNYVLKKFFAGDIARARDKNPKKKASYRALCRDERLVVKANTLSIMVRVAAQEQFFNLSGLDTSGLCYTHKAELIRLPDDQVKLDLAKEAIESSLSTRQLSEKVNEACKELSPKNFEIAVAILNNIENPRRIFEDSEIAPFVNDLKSLRKLSLQERRAISVEAKEMSKKTKEWMQQYEKLVRRLDKIDQ